MKKNATTRETMSPCKNSSTRVTRRFTNNYEARVVHVWNLQHDWQEDSHTT